MKFVCFSICRTSEFSTLNCQWMTQVPPVGLSWTKSHRGDLRQTDGAKSGTNTCRSAIKRVDKDKEADKRKSCDETFAQVSAGESVRPQHLSPVL